MRDLRAVNFIIPLIFLFFLSACGTGYGIYHRAKEGESLDSIAGLYRVNKKTLAKANSIEGSKKINTGDSIWIPGAKRAIRSSAQSSNKSATKRAKSGTKKQNSELTANTKLKFSWPVAGEVVSDFGKNGGDSHDGIDISGERGQEIKAAASGRIIYSGNDIKGYGNMVIIKHEGTYSTVYAHNEKNLVKKGDFVKRNAIIALLGNSGRSNGPNLHFEIRVGKKAKNPVLYLPKNEN